MRCVLDPPVIRGGVAVAAISRVSIAQNGKVGFAVFVCKKVPVAVLSWTRTGIGGHALDGTGMALGEIEALCPGAVEAFRRRVVAAS